MQQQENYEPEDEFNGEEPYYFSPSISKRRTVDGKTYYVRRFFVGGKDFGKTMEHLATRQAYDRNAG